MVLDECAISCERIYTLMLFYWEDERDALISLGWPLIIDLVFEIRPGDHTEDFARIIRLYPAFDSPSIDWGFDIRLEYLLIMAGNQVVVVCLIRKGVDERRMHFITDFQAPSRHE